MCICQHQAKIIQGTAVKIDTELQKSLEFLFCYVLPYLYWFYLCYILSIFVLHCWRSLGLKFVIAISTL